MTQTAQTTKKAAIVARAVHLACRRWERAHGGAPIALGTDLRAHLSGCPKVRACAAEQGLLHGTRLALAGLRLLDGERAERAARAAAAAELERLELERQVAAQRAAADRAARELAALRLLDALGALQEQLRAARQELEALDACAGADRLAQRGAGALVGDRFGSTETATGSACAAAPGARCDAWLGRKFLRWCDARWSARCRAPRHEPILRYLPGGAAAKPSPAAVRARRAYEQERALRALALAAKRWRLCWAPRRDSAVPAGADLGPYLAGSRKERRRQRPLYALGYLQQEAMVVAGAPQRLTAAGAAWLAEQLAAPPLALAA